MGTPFGNLPPWIFVLVVILKTPHAVKRAGRTEGIDQRRGRLCPA